MASRKPKPTPDTVTRSATGAELIDGAPFFAEVDGVRMNRRQYLAATKDTRAADLIAALTEPDA